MTDCPLPSFTVLAEVMHLCGNDHGGGDLGRKTKTTGDGLRFLRRPSQVFAQFLRDGSGTRIHHCFIRPPMHQRHDRFDGITLIICRQHYRSLLICIGELRSDLLQGSIQIADGDGVALALSS